MHSQPKFNLNQCSETPLLETLSIQEIVNKELSLIGTTADETLHMVSNVVQLLMRTGDSNSMTLKLSSSETLGFYNILGLVNAALEFEHDRIQSLDIEAA
jgi:hypothetical protein